MSASLNNQYVWLLETIRSAGAITKAEIDAEWAKSPLNTDNESTYPLRSFHRHREAIADIYGVHIDCDKSNGYAYFISRYDDGRRCSLQRRTSEMISFMNALLSSEGLQTRVFFDVRKTGSVHLAAVIRAMQAKCALQLTFLPDQNCFPVAVVPYAIQEKDNVWYLAAKPLTGEEVQVYDMSQVETATLRKEKQTMPRWFNGQMFFEAYFAATGKKKAPKPIAPDAKPAERTKAEKPAKEAKPKAEKPQKEATKPAQQKAAKSLPEQPSLFEQLSLF